MLNLILGEILPLILSAHQSPNKPHTNIDKTSLLWGSILYKALVLALLKLDMLIISCFFYYWSINLIKNHVTSG